MTFVHPYKTSNYVEMIKSQQEALTKSWVNIEAMPTLSVKDRGLVDGFGSIWFSGKNFRYDKDTKGYPVLDAFLKLCYVHGFPPTYKKRASKNGHAQDLQSKGGSCHCFVRDRVAIP